MKYSIGALAGVLVMLAGCGPDLSHLPKTVVAEGIVTIDGEPIENASVVFIADQGDNSARGITDASGKFSMRAFDEKPGAVPGAYRVQINKTVITEAGGGDDEDSIGTAEVKYGLPKHYAAVSTSKLNQVIPDEDITDIKFELTSK